MTAQHPDILIIRRRSSTEDEHHGGAWKIAFADFMTAMMAFFLVLWIISATDKNTKTIIARYFNPVKVEEPAKGQKGIRGTPELDANAPGKESGSANKEQPSKEKVEEHPAPIAPSREGPEHSASRGAGDDHSSSPERKEPLDAARPSPTMSEQELFSDPPASLDKIAGPPSAGLQMDSSATPKGIGETRATADDVIRDPFHPLGAAGPRLPTPETREAAPGKDSAKTSERQEVPEASPPEAKAAEERESPKAGRPEPIQPKTTTLEPAAPAEAKAAAALEARRQAAARLLADVKARLGVEADSLPGPRLQVQATDEGILISLTDRQNFSMFAIGSAEPQPRMVRMMDAVAATLKATQGALVLRGHTDAHPYRSPTYDNWRLSSARAQMSYYMLMRAGIAERRVERIEGFADHRLKDPTHPFAAENRRIEILLRESPP